VVKGRRENGVGSESAFTKSTLHSLPEQVRGEQLEKTPLLRVLKFAIWSSGKKQRGR